MPEDQLESARTLRRVDILELVAKGSQLVLLNRGKNKESPKLTLEPSNAAGTRVPQQTHAEARKKPNR